MLHDAGPSVRVTGGYESWVSRDCGAGQLVMNSNGGAGAGAGDGAGAGGFSMCFGAECDHCPRPRHIDISL